MQNIRSRIEGRKLYLEIDMDAPAEISKAGRSRIVAQSGRFAEIPDAPGFKLQMMLIKPLGDDAR